MSTPPPMPGNPPEPEQQSTPGTDRLTRRLVRSTACAAVGAVCLAWTALSAWGLLGTDLGQGHSRLLRLLAPLTLLMTLLLVRRRRENDARLFYLGVTVIMAGATTWCAVHQVSVCLTRTLPCRRQATTAAASALGMLAVLASLVTGPRTTWFVPVGSRQRTQRAIAGGGAVGVALLLLATAGGWLTERLSIDATHTSATAQSVPTSVRGTAWTIRWPYQAKGFASTVVGPALLTDALRVFDGRTGRELWHFRHRGAARDLQARLSVSPDGRHLVLVEYASNKGAPVTTATVFTADGHIVTTVRSAGGRESELSSADGPDAWGDAVALDGYWAFVDRHGLTARDWDGRQLWHADVPDGCRQLRSVTHDTLLLLQGCAGTHLQQMDFHGTTVWQDQLPEHTDLGEALPAPDWSATEFISNSNPFAGPSFVTPQLILGEHGKRSFAACGHDDCVPGPNLELWRSVLASDAAFTTVYDANDHIARRTRLGMDACVARPLVTGAANLCGGAPVLGPNDIDDQVLATSVQLPGSPTMSFRETPHILGLWTTGGSVLLLTCDEKDRSCLLRGLR